MPKVWRYLPYDETRVRNLSRELQVLPLVAQHATHTHVQNARLSGLFVIMHQVDVGVTVFEAVFWLIGTLPHANTTVDQ